MNFDVRYANHPEDSKRYDTAELRKHYHIARVFTPDEINLTYSHQDRIIAGGIMPVKGAVKLESCKELAAPYFLARRELGAINVGGPGKLVIDGTDLDSQGQVALDQDNLQRQLSGHDQELRWH